MLVRRNGRAHECVAIDLNTQHDFCRAEGSFPVRNRERLVPALRRVMAWARRNGYPLVSSMESHRLWELPKNGRPISCCIDGTVGQRKMDFTLLTNRVCVESDNSLAVAIDLFKHWDQVIFRKRTDDLLANPKADRFLTHLSTEEFIVFGNGLECDVKALVLGLLARSKKVSVVVDACGYWDAALADLSLRQMAAKGATLLTVNDLLVRNLDRRRQEAAAHPPSNGAADPWTATIPPEEFQPRPGDGRNRLHGHPGEPNIAQG
jgi:nicotinamidase-related amidase